MVPQLFTTRLLLQPIGAADQAFVFEGLSHPEVIRHYGVQYNTYEATGAQMQWYKLLVTEGTGMAWKIVSRQTGNNAGVIAVYFYKPEHQRAETGFWLLPAYWGKGFAAEALAAVMHYWKNEKALHRMEAYVEVENGASSRVLQKAGFVQEGTLRDYEVKNNRFVSLFIYAKLLT